MQGSEDGVLIRMKGPHVGHYISRNFTAMRATFPSANSWVGSLFRVTHSLLDKGAICWMKSLRRDLFQVGPDCKRPMELTALSSEKS